MVAEVKKWQSKDGRTHDSQEAAEKWELACDLSAALAAGLKIDRYDERVNPWPFSLRLADVSPDRARKILAALK